MSDPFELFRNPAFDRSTAYGSEREAVIGLRAHRAVRREVASWPEYAPTSLYELPSLAGRCGVAAVYYKDESERFGLGSFKALGAAYGVVRVLAAHLEARGFGDATGIEIWRGRYRQNLEDVVLTCATDGNHGRAVAWAAERFGCRCVVYVPSIVSPARRATIASHGAEVIRVAGTYDEALREADATARQEGRVVVSDQSYAGYEAIPRDIMQGYTISVAEAMEQLEGRPPPSHVLVQGGVGGFAAAVCGHLWESLEAERPDFYCVEPLAADCLRRSAAAGRLEKVEGDLETVMGCLSCGEASPLAWRVLEEGATGFAAIADGRAEEAMRWLAAGEEGDPRVVAGESGAAGVAGLLAMCAEEDRRRVASLHADARVLVFGTEGATDAEAYASIVGSSPEEVSSRPTRG